MREMRPVAADRRLAYSVILLVGLPSAALAVIGALYVGEAKAVVERRHREAARELELDLNQRLAEALRAEESAPSSLPFWGDASGLRFPRASGPSPFEEAYALAFGDAKADSLFRLLERRGPPAEIWAEAERSQAPWADEARLLLALEQGRPAEAYWEVALPSLPLDLARETLERAGSAPRLQALLALHEAHVAAARRAVAAGAPEGCPRMLDGGEILVARREGARWSGALIPFPAAHALLGRLSGGRAEALGLRACLAAPLRVALEPGAGNPTSRLSDLRAVLLMWAAAALTALVAAGSWLVIRGVRRQAHEVRLKSDFVSSVSHELKTPLTSIRMFVDTLQMGRAESPDEIRECLGHIARESERLSRLIEQVLTLARLEGGARRFVIAPASPAAVLDDARDAVRAEAEAAGIVVSVRSEPGLGEFPMDRAAVSEILTNLLTNAVKYGGGEVTASASREAGGLRLEVADRGPGIPEGEGGRLFERFFRGSNAGGKPGTGLGLAIVKALAEGQGGRVEASTAPGRGTRFSVWLPGAAAAREAAVHA